MKNILYLFLTILLFQTSAFSFKITHPENQYNVVEEDAIFFTGKVDRTEKLYINDVLIKPEKNRAFSYFTDLKQGENIFAIKSKDLFGNIETKTYYVIKDTSHKVKYYNTLIEDEQAYYITTHDNVVLRSTPIDAGMNRIGYLPKSTKIIINGKQNQFSRVYLTKNLYGWVKTSDIALLPVEKSEDKTVEIDESKEFIYTPITVLSSGKDKTDDTIYTVKLSENAPYSLIEDNNKLTLSIYNVDKPNEVFTKDFSLAKFSRYSLTMKDGSINLVLKKSPINKNNYSNKNVKVVIDAGHGGRETGAVGCLGHKEKDLNIDVAHKLKRILKLHDFDVYMTRDKDEFVSLQDRVDFAKSKDALVFISIHLNSVPISSNPDLNTGTITFYYNPVAKDLASELSNQVSKELGTLNSGASQASYAVIRPTEYIGALIELAYLVNPKDVSVYKSKLFAHKSAWGIYRGLVNYLHKNL